VGLVLDVSRAEGKGNTFNKLTPNFSLTALPQSRAANIQPKLARMADFQRLAFVNIASFALKTV